MEFARERVKAERGVARVKARLTAIAVNDLWPHHSRASGLQCAVVLRAALKMLGIISSNRQALELQRRKSFVKIVEERRNRGQQLLARRKVRAGQAATVTLRRDVGKSPLERTSPPSEPKIAESVPGISTIA